MPSTIDQRGIGATSTDCRNPSRRSSMIEIVAKMAVNSRISTSVPGKKYSRYDADAAPASETSAQARAEQHPKDHRLADRAEHAVRAGE